MLGPVTEDPQKHSVLLAERALQAAMLASDVEELDRLLHPELVAVGPDGQMINKPGDLAARRAGIFKITELREEEVHVTVLGDLALTFVVLDIRGSRRCRRFGSHALHAHVDPRRWRLAGDRGAHQPSEPLTRQALGNAGARVGGILRPPPDGIQQLLSTPLRALDRRMTVVWSAR